jgi:predicted tellurium resistance membrane protein TerC
MILLIVMILTLMNFPDLENHLEKINQLLLANKRIFFMDLIFSLDL